MIYVCSTCKKGEMEEKSILTGTLDSDLDTRTELICNVCKQKLVQTSHPREYVSVSDNTDVKKDLNEPMT
jgi:hypothetical protein